MFSEKTLHRLVILLAVRVLLLQGLQAAQPEPMMYKLRRGNDLEIRHLVNVPPMQSIEQLKDWIVNCLKTTSYPIEGRDEIQIDIYYKSVFDPKYRMARMVRPANTKKAKIKLYMTTLNSYMKESSDPGNMLLANQKKRAS